MKLNPQAMGFFSSLIIIGVGLIFSGCDVLSGFGIGTSAQYSLVPTEGLTTESIPQEDFFYVNLSASYYYGEGHDSLDAIIYAMDEGPGTDCKISVNEDSTEDLYCILDVMEGDLFFHKLVLEYNVPPEMCAYSGFLVPYHLNQEVAYGPRQVSKCKFLERNENAPTQYVIKEEYCGGENSCGEGKGVCLKEGIKVHSEIVADSKTESTCDSRDKCERAGCQGEAGDWDEGTSVCSDNAGNPVTDPNCDSDGCEQPTNNCGRAEGAGAGEWHVIYTVCDYGDSKEEIQELCSKYNKSEKDLGNCCLGTYDLDDDSSNGSWGGDLKECIGGPGRFAWDSYNKGGYPITEVTNTKKDGLKDTYELDAIINIFDGLSKDSPLPGKKIPSFITANHWEDVEDKEFLSSDSKLKMYFSTDPPGYFGEVDDFEGNPYFVWTCLDRAKEVRHRILLLIREWNTQKEYNRFKESLGSSGDPDIAGEEGSLCDYYTSDEKTLFERDSLCNDFLDIDDFKNYTPPYPEVIYKDSG